MSDGTDVTHETDATDGMSELEKRDAYFEWLGELKKRYRATQIKAAVSVNAALLEFYWELGRDISERYPGKKRDVRFFQMLSADLKTALPDAKGLSPTSIKYSRYFYELYAPGRYRPQVADDNSLVNITRRNSGCI